MDLQSPITTPNATASRWQADLKRAIRSPRALGELLKLPEDMIREAELRIPPHFPFFVTREFALRISRGDPHDPLLLQVWPTTASLEAEAAGGEFETDPVGDQLAIVADGLLHKYRGRVLLVTSGACAIHCRYCFRQHFDYSSSPRSLEHWLPAIKYVAGEKSIKEVILSGGDPLTMVDAKLAELVGKFEQIPHVRRLRIHTRLPIVLPSRIDEALVAWLRSSRLAKWVVVHCNHAAEVDAEVEAALDRLRAAGCTLLNQAVLLAGINDTAERQRDLCERLIDCNVVPYYLNQLDRVRGAEKFATSNAVALQIIDTLRRNLPGYAVPRFVRERPSEPFKSPVVDSAP